MSLARSITCAKVTLDVADLDRALRFYGSALGFALRLRVGSSWAEVTVPGLVLALRVVREIQAAGDRAGTGAGAVARAVAVDGVADTPTLHLAFEVDELDAALDELALCGIGYRRSTAAEGGLARLALVHDPDGHPLLIREAAYAGALASRARREPEGAGRRRGVSDPAGRS